eukprot:3267071-Pleurochrysis_carterae.AAC.1
MGSRGTRSQCLCRRDVARTPDGSGAPLPVSRPGSAGGRPPARVGSIPEILAHALGQSSLSPRML